MDLYEELMLNMLKRYCIQMADLKDLKEILNTAIESESYRLLEKIVDIVRNTDVADDEAFEKIEEIVNLFEENHLSAGCRHDFG